MGVRQRVEEKVLKKSASEITVKVLEVVLAPLWVLAEVLAWLLTWAWSPAIVLLFATQHRRLPDESGYLGPGRDSVAQLVQLLPWYDLAIHLLSNLKISKQVWCFC